MQRGIKKIKQMKQFLIAVLGTSWKSTLTGFAEAVFVQVLDYVATHAMGDSPQSRQLFFGGLGLSVCMLVRGRISKDANVSNSPNPIVVAQTVIPVEAPTLPPSVVQPVMLAKPVVTVPLK